MANKKQILRGATDWLLEKFIEKWPWILSLIGGGGGMSYLASITKYLEPYQPLAWGLIGLLTILIISGIYFIYGLTRSKLTFASYLDRKSETNSTVNVLAPIHTNERINISDFYHPFFKPTENARFENCDLMGPCLVGYIGHTLFNGGVMQNCEIVLVRPPVTIIGATVFSNCSFVNCHFYRVTWMMTEQNYNALPQQLKNNVAVISGIQAG